MTSTMAAATMARSTALWFDDGTLILQVETTQFKVHRGVLCAHSTVFRDMHSVPQPAESGTQDGCPLVVLKDDCVTDWTNLLEYIYFPAKVTNTTSCLDFPRVASLMRLGRKYVFEDIYAFACRIVRTQVPAKRLSEWESYFYLFGSAAVAAETKWTNNNEFDLLNLAIEHDMEDILPIAYYLSMLFKGMPEIVRGKRRADGSMSTIRSDALLTLLIGREKILSHFRSRFESWVMEFVPSDDCVGNAVDTEKRQLSQCEAARLNAVEKYALFFPEIENPLAPLDSSWYKGFCEACTNATVAYHEEERQSIWRTLPEYFDLPVRA